MMKKDIRAVIFDIDGLTKDTEGIYDEVIQRYAVFKTGDPLSEKAFRKLRADMFGQKPEVSAKLLHEALKLPASEDPNEYLRWREPITDELFPTCDFLPGAEKLIRHLTSNNVPMAIGTSTSRKLLEQKFVKGHDALELFGENVVTSDEEPGGKAAIFRKAAQLLGYDPTLCLVLEDAPSGVVAAKEIGSPVVVVPHPLLDQSLVKDADQILDSLEDFSPEEWGLPAY